MTLSREEFQKLKMIDDKCEMLSQQKMAKHWDDVLEGNVNPKDKKGVPIGDFSFYKCFIPLPEENDRLNAGLMFSYKTPTGEEFLEITPIDSIKQSAEEHQRKTGEDVIQSAFNSYQECRKNPNLISFEKMTYVEIDKTSNSKIKEEN